MIFETIQQILNIILFLSEPWQSLRL